MVGDVDEQVLQQETLERGEGAGRIDTLSCLGRQRTNRHHYAGLVVVARHIRCKTLDLLDAHGVVLHEFDVDGAALRLGRGVDGGRGRRVLLHHGLGGARGEGQLRTAVVRGG